MTYDILETFIVNSVPQISCLHINFTYSAIPQSTLESIHRFHQFYQRKNFFLQQNNVTIPQNHI